MKTEDHKIIAKYFMKDMKNISSKCKKAFCYGAVFPDINALTYIKGSFKYTFLHGHNYLNSRKSVFKMIDKLKNKDIWSVRDFYKFGKLIHYVTDAFTYAHNDYFKGNLKEHIKYEEELHKAITYLLKPENSKRIMYSVKADNIYEYYEKMHEKYEKALIGFTTDVYYIREVSQYFIDVLIKKVNISVIDCCKNLYLNKF